MIKLLIITIFAVGTLCETITQLSQTSSQTSSVSGNNVETSYTNNNGVIETYKKYTTLEQLPDGSCVQKTVEDRNGEVTVNYMSIDCGVPMTEQEQPDNANEKLRELENFDEILLKSIQDAQRMAGKNL